MELKLKNHKLVLIGIPVILTALIIIFIMMSKMTQNQQNFSLIPQSKPTSELPKINLPGKINLIVDSKNLNNSKLVLIASADSKNHQMTSFDIDIRYNNKKLKKESVEGMIAGFDFVPTDMIIDKSEQSELIITGIKSPYNTDPVIFSNSQLAKITFSKLAPFTSNDIELFFIINMTNDSNLVNIDNQDILGAVVNPSVE